jgi:hypothetical protein
MSRIVSPPVRSDARKFILNAAAIAKLKSAAFHWPQDRKRSLLGLAARHHVRRHNNDATVLGSDFAVL